MYRVIQLLILSALLITASGCEVLQQKWGEIQPSLQRNPEHSSRSSDQAQATSGSHRAESSSDLRGELLALTPTTKRLFDQQYQLQFQIHNRGDSVLSFDKVAFHMWLGGREFIHGVEPRKIELLPGRSETIQFPAYANMLDWTEDAKTVRRKGRDEYAYLLNVKLDTEKLLSVDKNVTMKGMLDLVATEKGLVAENIR